MLEKFSLIEAVWVVLGLLSAILTGEISYRLELNIKTRITYWLHGLFGVVIGGVLALALSASPYWVIICGLVGGIIAPYAIVPFREKMGNWFMRRIDEQLEPTDESTHHQKDKQQVVQDGTNQERS